MRLAKRALLPRGLRALIEWLTLPFRIPTLQPAIARHPRLSQRATKASVDARIGAGSSFTTT